MTGNKGEWSELYTFFKLAADGKLYAADENTNRIESIYYNILQIIRSQTDGKWNYIRNGNIKIVSESTGETIAAVPISEFKENTELLFNSLKSITTKSGSFEIPDVWDFAQKVKCNTLKAKSADKSDITLLVHDDKTGSDSTLGFSIKSQMGGASTLLNASTATNFTYEIIGHCLSDDEKNTFAEFKYFKDKFNYLDSIGATIKFNCLDSSIFKSNLTLVDMQTPKILAFLTECFYRGQASSIVDLTKLCEENNICNLDEDDIPIFYSYKIKELLTNIALGMVPSTRWNGNYDATGGYIIVKEDGDVLCYHIYNRNEFREYLFKNTKLDTPSKKKHGFGSIMDAGDKQMLKLNLQIRFVK